MFRKMRVKSRLNYAFEQGGLYREYGEAKHKTFPRIHSIKFFDERIEFVFTLPNGLDPKEMQKKEYVFHQVFGRNTEIRGDLKRFVMNVYEKSIPKTFNYNVSEIDKVIEDISIPIVCGQDIQGELIAYNMIDSPHLLIAGETGSGKSTQLRSILTTLIRSQNPENLRLVLGDLKRSEFHVFKNIAHVDSVATDTTSLANALAEIENEMIQREEILDRHEKTHMNEIQGKDSRPNIIICIDEVTMLKKEKEIMSIIEDVSAIGRALGIYLILSMQRPDRYVLDGKLKNNLTVRMAFRHADAINSRITIGRSGAENLPSQPGGRMLLKMERLKEIQAPFLDNKKARKLVNPYRITKVDKKQTTKVIDNPDPPLFGRLDD